jgi:hypothetical protein
MKKIRSKFSLPEDLCRGVRVPADYHAPEIGEHAGNPLIEALPKSLTQAELRRQLQMLPAFSLAMRNEPTEIRRQSLSANLKQFFLPRRAHRKLEEAVSLMIREGYLGRNPVALRHYERLSQAERVAQGAKHPGSEVFTTPSALLTGMSGTGKSFSLEKILKLSPQIIDHTSYKGEPFPHTQIVWLKLDCPRSTKDLCTSFFQAVDQLLGANYLDAYWGNQGSTRTMAPGMARVALLHSLGLLVLDEAQTLKPEFSGGDEELMNFLIRIENTLGVPVLLVGNASVLQSFGKEFRAVRRGTYLREPHWFRLMENSRDWEQFMTALWVYNYLHSAQKLTDQIRKEFYYHTQGVPDFVVKLFKAVQLHLMDEDDGELITPAVISEVAFTALADSRQVITAIRKKQISLAGDVKDICIEDIRGNVLPPEEIERLADLEEAPA